MLAFAKLLSYVLLSLNSKAEGVHYGCDTFGSEVELTFQGQVQLHDKFMSSGQATTSSVEVQEAVRHQMRYARGYFINARKNLPYALTVDAENLKIEVTEVQSVPYGKDLAIEPVIHPGVKIEAPYILRAFAAKAVHAKDPSKLVSYTAKASAYYCGPQASLENIEAAIPKDPYLMYWSVAKSDRRNIGWRHAKFNINPCADPEFADIPDPFYYWYFWNPFQAGKDLQHKGFQCEELLKKNEFYTLLKPKVSVIKASESVAVAPPEETDTLKTTVIFGVIDEQDTVFPWKPFLTSIAKKKSLAYQDFQRLLKSAIPQASSKPLDRGSQYLIGFVEDFQNIATVTSMQVSAKEAKVTFSGKLHESNRPLELVLWFGYTDVLGLKPPQHWQVLKQALASSQYILYNGHSGLGNNMKIDNILDATNTKAADLFKTMPAHQMIAYFSCYSYGYFGDDIVAYRQQYNPSAQTDVLLTGSEFTSERGPLGLLKHLDFFTAKRATRLDRSVWLFEKDQLIVKSFPGLQKSKGSL